MAERINISIPEDLHKRLSNLKNKIKISKICQEAIRHEVRIEEMKANAPSIDTLMGRLKKEELKYGKKYIEEGFEYGIKDSFSRLTLNDFLYIEFSRDDDDGSYLKWHDSGLFTPSEETLEALKKFDERTSVFGGKNGFGGDERCQLIDVASGMGWMLEPKHYFFRGWLDGVYHIWDQVKEKLIGLDPQPEQLRSHINYLQKEAERDRTLSEDDYETFTK
jgi:hypothetical protein